MTSYQIITALISLLAVIISTISLIRTRRVEKEQLELQKITAELSRKQIKILDREEKDHNKAQINVQLIGSGNEYKFVISNQGNAKAKNIYFELDSNCKDNPLVKGDYEEKIPIPSLNPGNSVDLIAAICMGSEMKYNIIVKWDNPDGTHEEDNIFVAI